MCRRKQLQGALVVGLGIGILVGFFLDSWILCCVGGVFLLFTGLCMMNPKGRT